MTAPIVSVVLATFNRLKFLRFAVESVFAQTLQDWELIVADDGSDQETRAYLASIARLPRVRLILLPHSGNPSAVRNAALREATGEYVAFLDSDDVWMPTKLERQVAALREDGHCRWIYTGYVLLDAQGQPDTRPSPKLWIPHRGAIFEQLLRLEAALATAAVLVERALLLEVGVFDEEILMFEHYDLWLRLARRSDVELLDEPLTGIRSHDQHYSQYGIPTLAARGQLLRKVRRFETNARRCHLIDRLSAQVALELSSAYANTDRLTALKTLAQSCVDWIRCGNWWSGAPRVLLKIAVPRALLTIYRAHRIGAAGA
jgi:glycosyltransferase involved in cell wall biosynthesis